MELGSSATAHLVTRQMAHSATTEAQYYQAIVGDKHAASALSTMTNLMSGKGSETERSPKLSVTRPSAGEQVATSGSEGWSSLYKQEVTSESQTSETESMRRARRRPFTVEETEAVRRYFSRHIEGRHSASLSECKTFLFRHKMDRSAKNIQDKVRNLSKI